MDVGSPLLDPQEQQPKSSMERCNSASSLDVSSEPTDVGGLRLGTKSIYITALIFIIYLAVGLPSCFLMRDQLKGPKKNKYSDTFYFFIVTMTTVGYGDLVPDSVATKLVSCIIAFTGMAFIALFLSNVADNLIEKQQVLLIKALRHCYKAGEAQMDGEIETKRLRNKLITTTVSIVVLMLGGTIFLRTVEKLSWLDAFYCVCSTVTTLGYGDMSFTTGWGRFFSGCWMLMSTLYVAQFFVYLAKMYAEPQRQAPAKSVPNRSNKAVDLNDDGAVGEAKFIISKLKEMGKIRQEDITVLMEKFRKRNVNH